MTTKSKYTVNGDRAITFTRAEREGIIRRLKAVGMDGCIARQTMFVQSHGGGIVGECALWALRTAKAIEACETAECEFRWEADRDADYSFIDTWPEADQKRWNRADHESESCVLYSADGDVLASLGGIIDADSEYRKVVQGELALEALDAIVVILAALEMVEEVSE